jgi:hypothetical protein
MEELATQIAVLVAVVAVILDKVLPWVAKARNGGDPAKKTCTDLTLIKQQLARLEGELGTVKRYAGELHRWHDKEDDDGVKVWYVRQSLENAINKLAEAADAQTRLLEEVLRNQDELKKKP